MEYFAGLFDAEGCISLSKKGAFSISIEMANEEIPNLFKDKFQGSIYTRKRKNRKKTWTWKINSIRDQAIFFIDSIYDFSQVKRMQLYNLRSYLSYGRSDRKYRREDFRTEITRYKQPESIEKYMHTHYKPSNIKKEEFFKWFAGFIDGDGNFCCNQYIDNRDLRKRFGHQLSFSSIYGDFVLYIDYCIKGTITKCQRTKNILYKWTVRRENERFLCQSILPFLKIKKKQCELFLEFIDSSDDRRKFEIINQIKHLNSL